MSIKDADFAFWAKLPKGQPTRRAYHPVLCHLIDVAAVTDALWHEVLTPAARTRVARDLQVAEEAAGGWVAFLAGVHDIGKVSPAFQFQVTDREVRDRLRKVGFPEAHLVQAAINTPHGTISAFALKHEILDQAPYVLESTLLRDLAVVIGGHHGIFPKSTEVPGGSAGTGPWRLARRRLVDALAAVLQVRLEDRPQRLEKAAAMFLAGLISVADWVGSSTEYFPYAVPDPRAPIAIDAEAYYQAARRQAAEALRRLGWTAWAPATGKQTFVELFDKEPRGVQTAAIALASGTAGPTLAIIEAPMGEGKTEAALYFADAWTVEAGQGGCYFALPTQATSNQMFGRVREYLSRRYPADVVNLQLIHGHAALSAEFKELREHHDRLFQPVGIYDQDTGASTTGGDVVAAEWFTHRKRGLLAPFGVGTIDQALLAVLQTKHVFVKLFGLAHKTVILDEVHAYDTYMTTLIERLLEWLAALGTSVVILSATLPRARREALLAAYGRGLGLQEAPPFPVAGYPRLTMLSNARPTVQHVPAAKTSRRRLQLEWMDGTPAAMSERLRPMLTDGGCVAVICNTVKRAQEVYRALRPHFPGNADDGMPVLDLFHARFPFKDRQQREQRALLRFGKEGVAIDMGASARMVRRPDRAVLVATQVIEQSLDLDFDLMITDAAPVDLVLQRSGRLHRHPGRLRPPRLNTPLLWICRPEMSSDGVPVFERGFEYVYDAHVLLRSWLALRDRSVVEVPDEVQALIEAVYGGEAWPTELSVALQRRWQETLADHEAEEADYNLKARDHWVPAPHSQERLWHMTSHPQEEDAPDLHPAHRAVTRLGEETVQAIFLTPEERTQLLDRPLTGERVEQLLLHMVALGDRRVVWRLLDTAPPKSWAESALLRHCRLVALDERGEAPVAGTEYRIVLDPEVGVEIVDTRHRR